MDGCGIQDVAEPATAPFSDEAFAAIRRHPAFREAVGDLASGNLANYCASSVAERWLTSDLGRAALTGAAMVLDAMLGGFSAARLVQAALANRTCSEGRARHYLRRATANGFLDLKPEGTYGVSPRLRGVLWRGGETLLRAAACLDPNLQAAPGAFSDPGFRRRFLLQVGLNTAARPDLFNGPDKPIVLFLGRDGGTRVLEQMLVSQPAGRDRLLETALVSQRALAKSALVSRTHIARLLAEGEALGLLRAEGRRVAVSPELSEDVERHYALIFEMARASAHAALANGDG